MTEPSVLEYRVTRLEDVVDEIRQAVKSIDQSLQTLAVIEQRHAETREGLGRAFGEIAVLKDQFLQGVANVMSRIDQHEIRMDAIEKTIEKDIPPLKETRQWVVRGVLAVVGLVGLALVGLVLIK